VLRKYGIPKDREEKNVLGNVLEPSRQYLMRAQVWGGRASRQSYQHLTKRHIHADFVIRHGQVTAADESAVYNPREPNDRLLLGVKGTLSEAELFTLRTRL
jgi:hypothetical protein